MANRGGEAHGRWSWVEHEVWTERMLEALETGPRGGRWYSLYDKVTAERTLMVSFRHVKRNGGAAGVDATSIAMFEKNLDQRMRVVQRGLKNGSYRPMPVRRVWIPKAGKPGEKRPLGIPTVRDRVVQQALKSVMEPIFEKGFHPSSYGFRPGRRAHDALQHVVRLMNTGHRWVVDADLKSFFDTIPQDRLIELVEERISDGKVLELLRSFLQAGVMEEGNEQVKATTTGTPQGGVISPLLANIMLNGLDHEMGQKGHHMVRYADDLVALCRTEADAREALSVIQAWTERMGLRLHPTKTRLVDMSQDNAYFEFLGFQFRRYRRKRDGKSMVYRFVRDASLLRLRHRIRPLTKRCNGKSLEEIIRLVNAVTRGWFEHFRSAHRSRHAQIDQWLRRRLRSILRRRSKRHGISRGLDHNRWPNAFFKAMGLFSLEDAHLAYVQSHRV